MEAFRLPDARTLGAPVPPRNLADLERVAKEQLGLLTRGQCLGAGMSDDAIKWRVRRGWWVTVHPGVYLTVPGRDDWWLRALAAQLAIDDAAWSHATAAFVHGLTRTPPRTVELIVGHDRRVSTPRGVLIHRRRGDVNRFVDELHWPWRTTVEDTILDICVSASVDETFALLGRAFQRRLTSEAALRGHCRSGPDTLGDSCSSWCSQTWPTAPRAPWSSGSSETSNGPTACPTVSDSCRCTRTGGRSMTSATSSSACWSSWTAVWVTKARPRASRTVCGTAAGRRRGG